ncbi:MAG TPA: response regulator [Pseudobdellovibrionaceae bacterium]|nr:response regulator [Pseudobdellovibrionaceae bacterium]
MRILTIEDSPDLQLLYQTVIRMVGYECIGYETATEARRYLLENPAPDLIMLDLTLPDLDLSEFRSFFAQIPNFDKIPLLVSSGRDDLHLWAQSLGAFHALKKPVDIPSLRTFLKDFNEQRSRRKDADLSL